MRIELKSLALELKTKWENNLKHLGVKLPSGKSFNKLLCLYYYFPKKVSQDEMSNWHRENNLPKYDLQARHLASLGWDIRYGNKRFTQGKQNPELTSNELILASIDKPNPFWRKDDKKRINNLSESDWEEILEEFKDRGCAVCGRKFEHYDKGHLLKTESYEKGNIVPMCSECNNWGQEVEFKEYNDLVYRPILKK